MKIYSSQEQTIFIERMNDLGDKIIQEHPELSDPTLSERDRDARYELLLITAMGHDHELMMWFLHQIEDELTAGHG